MFDCIVSLTSWKGRINCPSVIDCLNSIVNQETKYNYHIVFVLSTEEFPQKEQNLPQQLVQFINDNQIELLWTTENLKAYKKLYPVQKKYPNLPIMTTDDDIMLEPNCIETFMAEHEQDPTAILSEGGRPFSVDGETLTGIFRLYPPHSLLEIDPMFFKYWFKNCEDDAYCAILAWAKDTPTKILKIGLANELKTEELSANALRKTYWKINNKNCKLNLLKALKKLGLLQKPIDGIIKRYEEIRIKKELEKKKKLEEARKKKLEAEKKKKLVAMKKKSKYKKGKKC